MPEEAWFGESVRQIPSEGNVCVPVCSRAKNDVGGGQGGIGWDAKRSVVPSAKAWILPGKQVSPRCTVIKWHSASM